MRAHWMAHELDLPYEAKLIGSRTGETQSDAFRSLNPKEKIPVLVDGDFVLTESAAIMTYLGETYGVGSGLVPEPRTRERARYDEWNAFVQMELDAHTLYVLRKHRDLVQLYGDAPAAVDTAIEGFQKQVAVAEQALQHTDYLVGNRFTGADIMLTTTLQWAIFYEVTLPPRLVDYTKRHASRPAYKRAGRLNFSIDVGA